MHRSHDVNECVAYFEEHPELEVCDGVDDATGEIEDVEEIAIPMPRIQTQMVERTADVPQILTVHQPVPVPQVTTQTVARPYPAPQLQTMDVPMPQVMIQEMFKQYPVRVMKSVDVLVSTPVVRPRRKLRRCSATDRGKCPVSVPSAMKERWAAKSKSRSPDAETVKKAMTNATSTLLRLQCELSSWT